MKKVIFLLPALLLFFCVSTPVMAFNNQRKGFIVGVHGGIGLNIWDEWNEIGESYGGSDYVFRIGLRIGGGISDRVVMYLFTENYLNLSDGYSDYESTEWADYHLDQYQFSGFGISIYLRPTTPSLYIFLGAGNIPDLWHGVGLNPNPFLGGAITGGIGYEFFRHFSTEANIIWRQKEEMASSPHQQILTLAISVVAIAY
jgi:hypothetical protein